MLAQRIVDTLRFFDLQQLPLTSFEIHKYLIAETTNLKTKLDGRYELSPSSASVASSSVTPPLVVHFDTILTQLHILVREEKIKTDKGFYCLPGREQLINDRLQNYLHGIKREKLVRRYLKRARHIPFVRGIALAGSQALGQQRATSDIDLLVITEPNFLGLTRLFLTVYFQIFGIRRHGKKISNRFCLNHYLAGTRALDTDRNLYTAFEYLKLRPVVYGKTMQKFVDANSQWIQTFFPNASELKIKPVGQPQSKIQKFLEQLFNNKFGLWIEKKILAMQLARIKKEEFSISNEHELSFHPNNRKQKLFAAFFEHQQLHHRKTE
ncbi:MAG TPA: nucleotidyltransferase domain-containing protein [Patescibacteria group bacterium]|jgi:hypothetical protein|nr:nucleotidyltransferase domain-containing protein [Patescibacteria group bacterium]